MSFRLTKNKVRLAGAILALCSGTVVYHEGTGLSKDGLAHSYKDSASVWTICSGDTANVRPGQVETAEQCHQRLQESVTQHAQALAGFPSTVPDYAVLGSVDFAYHVGAYAAKNSTVFKLERQGKYTEAGQAILSWRYITDASKRGKSGWETKNGKTRFDCSTVGNTVCAGIWKRRLWQADTISGRLGSAEEAEKALPRYDAIYVKQGKWVMPSAIPAK